MASIDIAMESTSQEILEKVGDLHTLQSQNKNMIPFVAYYSAHTGAKTVLDVTGSGELYSAYACCASAKNQETKGWMKITIDGELYLKVTFTNTHTTSVHQCRLFVYVAGFQRYGQQANGLGYFTVDGSTGNPGNFENESFSTMGYKMVGVGETAITNIIESVAEHAVPNPIRFNNSLKIEVYNGDSKSHYANALYSLDEE